MSIATLLTAGLQIAMGVSLAACAGFRAFLPLLAVGLAGRMELIPLGERFEWLAGGPALAVLGTAVIAEILADKVPVVDHLLDLVSMVVRPLAGAVAMAAPLVSVDPLFALVIGAVVGGTVAGGVHVTKSQTRLLSTASTGGAANPLVSVGEDALALAGSLAAILVPVVAFVVVVVVVLWVARRRARRRRRGREPGAPMSPAADGPTA